MKTKFTFILAILCCRLGAQQAPSMRYEDKIRIREALSIVNNYGEQLFQGITAVPFAILLIDDSTDFLINHPYPSADFKLSGKDEILGTNIYYRKSQFNPHLLATFPAVNGLSCIVVGTPENTNKNSSEWIITLIHEHFHQYQNADSTYYAAVNGLQLSGGDETGMWMLNYPFPYDSLKIIRQFEAYSKALSAAVNSIGKSTFNSNIKTYKLMRSKFKNILAAADYRYFSFQIWQEGLARYVEYQFLKKLATYKATTEVKALPDFVSFSKVKQEMYINELANLRTGKLNENRRIIFYSMGFAEGILLDAQKKNWRNKYRKEKFSIEGY